MEADFILKNTKWYDNDISEREKSFFFTVQVTIEVDCLMHSIRGLAENKVNYF